MTVLTSVRQVITLSSVKDEFSNIELDYSSDQDNKKDYLQRLYKCKNDLTFVEDNLLKEMLLKKINTFENKLNGASNYRDINQEDLGILLRAIGPIHPKHQPSTKTAVANPIDYDDEDDFIDDPFLNESLGVPPDEDIIIVSSYLRNDYACDIEYRGIIFPSVEHAFQAAKTTDPDEHQAILDSPSIRDVKRIGRRLSIDVNDWDSCKVDVMRSLLLQKFRNNKLLKDSLLRTKPFKIIMSSEKDLFWGMNENKRGQNKLGEILMDVRDDLEVL